MKYLLPLLLLALAPLPAVAQDSGTREDIESGVEMMTEGARSLLRGLMGEVDPAMRDLAERFRDWDFDGIGVDDLGRYQPPEVLPNGDIIIRRKPDAPDLPDLPEDGDEIDI